MNATERIDDKLAGRRFRYRGETFDYNSCKLVYSNVMVSTDKRTLQIPSLHADTFLMDEIEILDVDQNPVKQFLPEKQPLKNVLMMPEANPVFLKLNSALEELVSQITGAADSDLAMLEVKAKMLTSIGNTAVSMENSKVNIIKAISGQ